MDWGFFGGGWVKQRRKRLNLATTAKRFCSMLLLFFSIADRWARDGEMRFFQSVSE